MKTYYFLLSLFFFLSCNNDDAVLIETVFTENNTRHIKVEETNKNVVIKIESLEDFTDNRENAYPNGDFCQVIFDTNFNNQKDQDIDFGFGSPTTDYDICSFYLLENNAISPCGKYDTEAIFSADFASSELEETPHIIWTITIPKDEFPDNRMDFTVKVFYKGMYFDYPKQVEDTDASFYLNNTYSFEW